MELDGGRLVLVRENNMSSDAVFQVYPSPFAKLVFHSKLLEM